MRYKDLGDRLDGILKKRREISTGKSGLIPLKGHEDEFIRLTKEAEEVRKTMRRVRYNEDI